MRMAAQRILEMAFNTQLGKTQRIRVYDAKDPITGAEVAAAMEDIIAKNIFTSTSGNLTGKIDARLLTTDSSDLSLA
ncbi:MAG TPA: DUF2922 domain-containing protein [Syntrophomonas wolfei]|uniref:DUF2922 domain-containing protein n=2 Tax=Syntrophomonas wolfei TaxID=863 RepID=A0A354YYB8_9FIRM|nr:DUF2922 domain-containing protein [Syntrophomonas wolfei]